MKSWYVVGIEPDGYVNVFGPFVDEIDARAYALDVAHDNGWTSVEAMLMSHDSAKDLATDEVLWPYSEEKD